MTNEIVVAD